VSWDGFLYAIGNHYISREGINLTNIRHKAGKASMPNYRAKASIKPVGKGISNKEICNASKNSKLAFYQWKNDQTDIFKKQKMNKARKLLRSAQRRARASVRNTLAEKIMVSITVSLVTFTISSFLSLSSFSMISFWISASFSFSVLSDRDHQAVLDINPSPKPRMFNVYVESGKKKTLNWFDLVRTPLSFHLPLPCQRQFWI
jgi:hypothetical protein